MVNKSFNNFSGIIKFIFVIWGGYAVSDILYVLLKNYITSFHFIYILISAMEIVLTKLLTILYSWIISKNKSCKNNMIKITRFKILLHISMIGLLVFIANEFITGNKVTQNLATGMIYYILVIYVSITTLRGLDFIFYKKLTNTIFVVHTIDNRKYIGNEIIDIKDKYIIKLDWENGRLLQCNSIILNKANIESISAKTIHIDI